MILAALCTLATALFAWRAGKRLLPNNDVLRVSCHECGTVNKLAGSTCLRCNTKERILLRKGSPKGTKREMPILLYHCACSSRIIYCDLKCTACGAKISEDRRTELRPLQSYSSTELAVEPYKQNGGQETVVSLPAVLTDSLMLTDDVSASVRW